MRLELMSEIASLRRLEQLFEDLDYELSRVPVARRTARPIAASAA